MLNRKLLLRLGLKDPHAVGATLLWLMVLAMGAYQGVNPPMGWLYAVSRGLERRSTGAVFGGTAAYAAGHYFAMLAILLPAALILAVARANPMAIQPYLGVALIGFGLFKLHRRSHPRFLARISPRRPMRYSFAMALTHCGSPVMMLGPLTGMLFLFELAVRPGPAVAPRLAWYSAIALALPAAMAATLLLTASAVALLVYGRLGLAALTRFWINFDLGWAFVFLAMGAMALAMSSSGAMLLLPAWAHVLARLVCGGG